MITTPDLDAIWAEAEAKLGTQEAAELLADAVRGLPPRTCKRCGHLESVHDDINGCQVVTGCTPGSMQMEACDCEGFVPEDVL